MYDGHILGNTLLCRPLFWNDARQNSSGTHMVIVNLPSKLRVKVSSRLKAA
jgi:hypothetical protein